VTFTGSSALPTGTVTFWQGAVGTGIDLGTFALTQQVIGVGAAATPTLEFLVTGPTVTFTTTGANTINAVYSGDSNFASVTTPQTVTVQLPSTVAVSPSNANPGNGGVSVTETATVTGTGGTPTGFVQFYDNLIPVGTPQALDVNGKATITLTTHATQGTDGSGNQFLLPGTQSITAVYSGNATYFQSSGVNEQSVQANAFNLNHKYVYRVGDGVTNLIAPTGNPSAGVAAIGSSIYIDEIDPTLPDGSNVVQSIILPSNDGSGSQAAIHAIVGNGQQSATEQISVDASNKFLFLTGYDTNPLLGVTVDPTTGTPSGQGTTAPAIPTASGSLTRSVARIDLSGNVQDVAISATNSGSGFGNFNAVFSVDGNKYYTAGNGGVRYFANWTPSAGLQTPTASMTSPTGTTTALENDGGNLAVIGPPGFGNDGPQVYSGFPTTASSVSNLTGFSDANATAGGQASTFYIDAYFTHLDNAGHTAPAGINTFYLSDDGTGFSKGAITKWSLVGSTWTVVDHITANGTFPNLVTPYYLSGVTAFEGTGGSALGAVTLNVTYGNGGNADTGPGQLWTITDTTGYVTVATSGLTLGTQVAHVGTTSNMVYRGVAAFASTDLSGTGSAVTGSERTSTGTVTVANFTDPDDTTTNEPVGNYSATISWGDGSSSAGTIVFDSTDGTGSHYHVTGSHTYALPSVSGTPYPVTVTIVEVGSGPLTVTTTATISATANNTLPTDMTGTSVAIQAGFSAGQAQEGQPVTAVVANFADPLAFGQTASKPVSNYTVTIDWGDGSPLDTTGVISFADGVGLNGTFKVTGTHTYAESTFGTATYLIAVKVSETGYTGQVTINSTAAVADAFGTNDITGSSSNLTAFTNVAVTNVQVATFHDPLPFGAPTNAGLADSPGEYQVVSINWGDGSGLDTTTGSVAFATNGNNTGDYVVTGTHTYTTTVGSPFSITVVVKDLSDGSTTTLIGGQATVSGNTLRVVSFVGTSTGFVATFNHPVTETNLEMFGGVEAPVQTGLPSPGSPTDISVTLPVAGGTAFIEGSALFDSTGTVLTFVKTGGAYSQLGFNNAQEAAGDNPTSGLLLPGTYTVDLRSHAVVAGTDNGGFASTFAGLDNSGNLDGLGNDTVADFTANWTVTAPPAVTDILGTVSFARGGDVAGGTPQPIKVAYGTTQANPPGLPLSIFTQAANVTSIQAVFNYDPNVITVSGAVVGLPTGWTDGGSHVIVPGQYQITISGPALPAGINVFGSLQATVNPGVPYKTKEVLFFSNIVLGGGAAGVSEAHIHIAAYDGDVTGAEKITTTQDAIFIFNDSSTGNGARWDGNYKLLDPNIIEDVQGRGKPTSQGAIEVFNFVTGPTPPVGSTDLPVLPGTGGRGVGSSLSTAPGPDPHLFFTSAVGSPGQTVTVHLMLEVTEASPVQFQSDDIGILFDPTKVSVSNIRAGSFIVPGMGSVGTQVTTNGTVDNVNGTINAGQAWFQPTPLFLPPGAVIDILDLDYTILAGDPVNTTTPLNLAATVGATTTDFNGSTAAVNPYPTNGSTDANIDSTLSIIGPSAKLFFNNQNVTTGQQIVVPVEVTGVTGFTFQSDDIGITFDPTKLQGVSVSGTAPSGFANPNPIFGATNQAIVTTSGTFDNAQGRFNGGQAWFSANPNPVVTAGQTGDLLYLTFNVLNVPPGTTYLDLAATVGATTTDINGGAVTLIPAPTNATNDPGIDAVVNLVVHPNQPPFDSLPAASALPKVLFNPQNVAGLTDPTPNTVTLSGATAIVVSDTDAGNANVTTILTLTGSGGSSGPVGILTLASTAGLAVTGNNSSSVTLTGPISAINAALNGLVYTPGRGFFGTATLGVSTTDNGNSGFGGPLTDTRSTSITVVGLFLSEIFLNSTSNLNTPSANQYLEIFSTVPNYTIPSTVYMIGIEGDNSTVTDTAGNTWTNNPGQVQDRFNLGGFTTGSNGYLVLLQKNQPYTGSSATPVNSAGNIQVNNVAGQSGPGFGNGGASSDFSNGVSAPVTNVHVGEDQGAESLGSSGVRLGTNPDLPGDGATAFGELSWDIEQASASYLLIQASTAPAVDFNGSGVFTDIDANNDGVPDGAAYASWNVLDGVAILAAPLTPVNGGTYTQNGPDRAYAPITFQNSTNNGTVLSGSTLVSVPFTATYVGRISQNTGSSSADWLASVPVASATTGLFNLGAGTQTSNTNFSGQPLNHIGGPNTWAAQMQVLVNDGTSNQHSQVSELTLTFSSPVTLNGQVSRFLVAANGAVFNAGAGTATITFQTSHNFLVGQSVTVVSVAGTGWAGIKVITAVTANSITFASGTIAANGTVTVGTSAVQALNTATTGTSGFQNIFQVVSAVGNNPVNAVFVIPTGFGTYNATTGQGTNVTKVIVRFLSTPLTTLSFTNADPFGNKVGLVDGNFFLNTNATLITDGTGHQLDGDRNGTFGGNGHDEFWRLFGDTNGDRFVDGLDAAAFAKADGTQQSAGTQLSVTAATQSGRSVTVSVSSVAGFFVGERLTLSGVAGTNAAIYNSSWVISAVNTATNQLTFTVPPQATGGDFTNAKVVADSADYVWYLDFNVDGNIDLNNSLDSTPFFNNRFGTNGGTHFLAP
jgi:hypothetical protein